MSLQVLLEDRNGTMSPMAGYQEANKELNFIQQSFSLLLMTTIIFPCHHTLFVIMFLIFLFLFDINGEGNSPSQYLFPCALNVLLTTNFMLEYYANKFGSEITPIFC